MFFETETFKRQLSKLGHPFRMQTCLYMYIYMLFLFIKKVNVNGAAPRVSLLNSYENVKKLINTEINDLNVEY